MVNNSPDFAIGCSILELRGASPKTAAKDPISLDAILVCRKHSLGSAPSYNPRALIEKTLCLAKTLSQGGMKVSATDCFVIAASQTLVAASAEHLSFEQIKSRLEAVRVALSYEALQEANARSNSSGSELRTDLLPSS